MTKKKNISKKDIRAWKNYTQNPTDIFDKEDIVKVKESNTRFKFDLHGFSLLDANIKVREIIVFCF